VGDKINVVKEVCINNCDCKVSFEEECFATDYIIRCSYFKRDFFSESESEVRAEDGVGGESVDSVFSEYGERVGVEGREEETVQFPSLLEEAPVLITRGNGDVNAPVERKVVARISKECDYDSGEHAYNINKRHAKMLNSFNDTLAFVNK